MNLCSDAEKKANICYVYKATRTKKSWKGYINSRQSRFKTKIATRDKKGHFIIIKGSTHHKKT